MDGIEDEIFIPASVANEVFEENLVVDNENYSVSVKTSKTSLKY